MNSTLTDFVVQRALHLVDADQGRELLKSVMVGMSVIADQNWASVNTVRIISPVLIRFFDPKLTAACYTLRIRLDIGQRQRRWPIYDTKQGG